MQTLHATFAGLLGAVVFVIVLTFATVAWANRTVRPVRIISDRLRLGHRQTVTIADELPPRSPLEFRGLARRFDAMNTALRTREDQVREAADERRQLLGRLLPVAVARRVEAGDRKVIDEVPRATLVVLVVEGLDQYARSAAGDANGRLGGVIDELDQIALHHGVERVKIIGDAYYGACGVTRPYLDQVPRTVAFAIDVRDAIRERGRDDGSELDVRIGVHTGPVSVGLIGSSRLVYDLWGSTVSEAHTLAATAAIGDILLSDPARERLPDHIDVTTAERVDGQNHWRLVPRDVGEPAS